MAAVAAVLVGVPLLGGGGPVEAAQVQVCNTGAITINDRAVGAATPGTATPYPSTVSASVAGPISEVELTLTGVTHGSVGDLDVLLVSPTGASVVVVSDAGGNLGTAANATVKFDDDAAAPLGTAGGWPSGTWDPVDQDPTADLAFPAPAPAAPAATLPMSTFDGGNANGTWSLYVVDDALSSGAGGTISGGWCLDITTVEAAATATTVTSNLNPSRTGQNVTFTATVTSGGSPVTTGTVTFREGATVLGGPTAVNASGQAALTTSALTEGSHIITATYNGTASFATSNGSVTQVVDNNTTVTGNQYCNAGPITLGTGSAPQAGAPYPSRIFVSGVTGTVSEVSARLTGVTHTNPDDIDVLLKGPAGQTLILVADAGGTTDMAATTVNLDDDAAAVLPDATAWGASPVTARPTNHAGSDVFPAPAPAVSAATALSTFDGTNPNGTWELYAVDDSIGEVGSISGGWCLTIDAVSAVATTTTIVSNDNPSLTGDPVTFTATVTAGGSPVTSGTVTFREGATTLAGPTALNAAGQATFTTSTLTEGAHVVTADFNGTATAGPSTASVTQVVDNPTVVTNHRYCNAGAVTINAAGAATPYPSRIFVAGAGPAVGVTATLAGVSHPLPDDVDVLLRAPNGDNLVLVADAGGTTALAGVTVNFDDAAATGLPDTGGWGVSPVTADPTNHAPADTWPAPAPAPSAATTLAVFAGDDPNGAWELWVVDDAAGNAGSIAGGWCLTITTPLPNAGGPYSVAEGASITLDASGSGAHPAATYSWDVNGDGTFGDATGVGPTLTWAQLDALGLDGPASITNLRVQVTSGGNTDVSTATTLTVTNTAPTLSITAPASGLVENPVSVTLTATDASSIDQTAGFTFVVNWGDGSPAATVTGASPATASHTYTTAGAFTISATATDADGGSASASTPVTIGPLTDCTVTGTAGPDSLFGTAGDDVICGLGGNDYIRGAGGNDTLRGHSGDDVLVPGVGNDTVDGGAGADHVNYVVVTGVGVVIDLVAGTANAGTDTLIGIERATGTQLADTIIGNGADNVLAGLGGADIITGAAGDDTIYPGDGNDPTIDGGDGRDMVNYTGTPAAVTIDLPAGTATGGYGTDTLTSIENARGSSFNDILIGLPAGSTLEGNAGDDRLRGAVANDSLDGGPNSIGGGDVCLGMGGTDVIVNCEDTTNTSPTATAQNVSTPEDTALPITLTATDADGDALTWSYTQPAAGTVTGTAPNVTYTPTANACGPDSFTFTASDWSGAGNTATISLTVTCVDDAPVAVDDTATVAEDAAATAIAVLGNDTDVDAGTKAIASASDPANGTVVLTGGSPGAHAGLTYQPDANYCNTQPGGTADTFTYTLTPGGDTGLVSVTVTCGDDSPVAVDDTATVAEDAAATAIAVLGNDTDVDAGTKAIASASDPANGTVVLTGGTPGAHTGLTYQPDVNYCNSPPGTTLDTFTYTLTPGGDTGLVSVTVTCVDDPPVAVDDTATVLEDAGATAVSVLTNDTDIDAGPRAISAATDPANGTVVLTGGTPGAATGLTYQPDPNYCNTQPGGTADTFTYTLTPGGDTGLASITVTCVDDPPVAVDDSATVLEDAAATAVAVLANDTDIDAGPKAISASSDPANGTVVLTGGTPGAATGLTYQPDPNYCNTQAGGTADTFTYTLTPGGDTGAVSITVTCVNDAPTAGADSFDTIGNTELRVDLAAVSTPAVTEATGSANGVRGNDADPVENNPITVTSIVGCADTVAPYDCTVAGGTVSMTPDGDFSFIPSPTLASGAPTDTTFQYVVTDQPTVGTPATGTGTVTIHVYDKVWYVRQGATGNGTSTSPLGSFTGIAAGDGTDSDAPGDYIFVHNSGVLTSSIVLEANQHLLGEGVGLSINRNLNANGAPVNLVAAGTRPAVTSAATTVGVTAAMPVEIRGLSLASTGGNPIDVTTTAAITGSTTLTLSSNTFTQAAAEGVDVNLAATGTLGLSITANTWTGAAASHAGNAVDINRAAGTLNLAFSTNTNIVSNANAVVVAGGATTVTGFAGNSVSGDTAGAGISLSGVIFDATPGGTIQAIDADTLVIGTAANPVGQGGLAVVTSTGSIAFDDLDLYSASGTALGVSSPGPVTALIFNVAPVAPAGAGTSTILAQNGSALVLTQVTTDLRLADLDSTTTTAAVQLTTVAGQLIAPSGSTISKTSGGGGPAFSVASSSATVSYAGTVNVTSGSGVSLTTNSGTTSFTGQLTLNTATSAAFTATGGGTVAVTGSANTIGTTTGTALNVANTTIGVGGLTFQSIASNGAANGIVLNNTGATAGLTVTGTGGAGTGGTIQSTTNAAVSLTSTQSPSFTSVVIQNIGRNGIEGTDVTNFSFVNGTISNTGTAAAGQYEENAIAFVDKTVPFDANTIDGVVTITGSTINQPHRNGLMIETWNGTISSLTVSGNTFTGGTTTGDILDAIHVFTQGSATTNSNLTTATISNNSISGFRFLSGTIFIGGNGIRVAGGAGSATNLTASTMGTSGQPIVISGNSVTNVGSNGIAFSFNGQAGSSFVNVTNNGTAAAPMTNMEGLGISVFFGAGNNFTGTSNITGNFIGTNGPTVHAGSAGIGIQLDTGPAGGTTATPTGNFTVTNNSIAAPDGSAIIAIGINNAGSMDADIRNNTVGADPFLSRAAIRIAQNNVTSPAICLNLSGNSTTGGSGVNQGLAIRRAAGLAFGVVGLPAGSTATPAFEAYINSQNPSGGGVDLVSQTSGFSSCALTP